MQYFLMLLVNLSTGVFRLCKVVVSRMLRRGRALVVCGCVIMQSMKYLKLFVYLDLYGMFCVII